MTDEDGQKGSGFPLFLFPFLIALSATGPFRPHNAIGCVSFPCHSPNIRFWLVARRARLHLPGGFFHVTQRGNDRRAIFRDDQDHLRYLGFLATALEDGGERLHASCLLSNHVHLLVQSNRRPLSDLMQRVGMRHARAFNDRWSRCGHLFEARFHASHVPSDPHVLLVLRYIHLNPCAAGMVLDPKDYRWSSHRAYCGEAAPSWLFTRHVLGILHTEIAAARRAYTTMMVEGFGDQTPATTPSEDDTLPDLETATATRRSVCLDSILQEIARRSGCALEEIRGQGAGHRASEARSAVVHLARTLTGTRLTELARLFGRDSATLSNAVTRRLARPEGEWRYLVEGARLSLLGKEEKRKA